MQQGFKVGCGYFPKYSGMDIVVTGSKRKTQSLKIFSCRQTLTFHNLQNTVIKCGSSFAVIAARLNLCTDIGLKPAPFMRPKICRVDPVGANQLLNIAVLREKRNSRYRPTRQHSLQILSQRKAGLFNFAGGLLTALLRLLNKFLNCCFHGSKHQRRPPETHHFKCPDGLMQLLARNPKMAGIQSGQIRSFRSFSLPHKALECFCSTIKRFAQFVKHPSQRP